VFLPLWLLERPEISFGAKTLYAQLARNAGARGVAWPSQKFLARQLGIRERQLRTYLAEIRRAGLVEIEQRGRRKGGVGQTPRYWFVETPWMRASANYGRQSTAGQKGFGRQNTAGHKSAGLKDRARAAVEVSHKHEVSHRARRGNGTGGRIPRTPSVARRSNTEQPARKESVEQLAHGLAEKWRMPR
jgi:hypothetical protein